MNPAKQTAHRLAWRAKNADEHALAFLARLSTLARRGATPGTASLLSAEGSVSLSSARSDTPELPDPSTFAAALAPTSRAARSEAVPLPSTFATKETP